MKLPSIQSLADKSLNTLKRFPFVMLFAAISVAVAMYLTEYENKVKDVFIEHSLKLILTCYLGVLLFLSIHIFNEVKKVKSARYLYFAAGLILLSGYYFTIPKTTDFDLVTAIRFALFGIGLHLLVSFIAFFGREETNGFWQYNKIFFLRILTAALYTGVLYSGLALAMLAVETLFNLHIYKNIYLHLWFFMIGIFNTWFFLAGIPENVESLESVHDYPKGLKLFTQYVLLPLVTIYLFILYAYGIKIMLEWSLPKGWVSYLIIAFSITGILSILLIYPIQEREENRWMKTFSRGFYLALFPLIVLLFLAIYKRTSDYGITEERYFVLVVAGWLLVMALYFTLSKKKNIKVIPISLCMIAFLSSFGPWSAFNVSAASQKKRFENIFSKYQLLKDGKINKKGSAAIPFSDRKNISSIVTFFEDRKELKKIEPFFIPSLDSIINDTIKYNQANRILALIGLEYVYEYQTETQTYFSFYNYQKGLRDIRGYDYSLEYNYYSGSKGDTSSDEKITLGLDTLSNSVIINSEGTPQIKISLENTLLLLKTKYGMNGTKNPSNEEMMVDAENDKMKVRINIRNISAEENNHKQVLTTTNLDMEVLIKIKE